MRSDMAVAYGEPYAPPGEEHTAIRRGAGAGGMAEAAGDAGAGPFAAQLIPRDQQCPYCGCWKEVTFVHSPSFAHRVLQIFFHDQAVQTS